MSNIILWAIKIHLRDVVTPDANIGLYTESGKQVFRWIESNIGATTLLDWKEGVLAREGFSAISESVNTLQGGNISRVNGVTVNIDNTSQFQKTLSDLNINWNGLKAEIIELERNPVTDVITETTIFYGEINLSSWNETVYEIPLTATNYKRQAFMGTLIDGNENGLFPNASDDLIGKYVPLTYGIFDQDNFYSRFIRVADKQETFQLYNTVRVSGLTLGTINSEIEFRVEDITYPNVTNINMFPVTQVVTSGSEPSRVFDILTPTTIYDVDTDSRLLYGTITSWGNYFVKVTKGTGEGQYRRIESANVYQLSVNGGIRITVADYFKEEPVGNPTATEEDNSWIQFVKINSEFQCDVWPCKAYLDEEGVEITEGLTLFAYTDTKKAKVTTENTDALIEETPIQYLRLPQYGYEDTENGDNNKIEIDLKGFRDSPDQMDSFITLPVRNLDLSVVLEPSLRTEISAPETFHYFTKGYYSSGFPAPKPNFLTYDNIANLQYISDRDSTTEYTYTFALGSDTGFMLLLNFLPPEYPKNLIYDSVYIGINHTSELIGKIYTVPVQGHVDFYVFSKFFAGNVFSVLKRESGVFDDFENVLLSKAIIENIPDQYYIDSYNTYNKFFYVKSDGITIGNDKTILTGYENFELSDITDLDTYNNIDKMGLYIYTHCQTFGQFRNKLKELCFIFRKSVSIKQAIYSPFKGRIFDDTFESRKTASDVMINPIDILEHVCRLQNWSEVDATPPVLGYGKEYSGNALINTASTWGGFDNVDLAGVKQYELGFQLLDENDMWTETFKRKLCQLAWCINYTNSQGEESVASILQSSTDVVDLITFANVPRGMSVGDFIEPDVQNIFCEPYVRYRWDNGANDFQKSIKILNISQASWLVDYTPGLSEFNGERLWLQCKENWNKYAHLEQPTGALTDQKWIKKDEDAVDYLENWIANMTRKIISIPVSYNTKAGASGTYVKTWNVGHHFYINLPHHTNGVNVECYITSISKNKNKNYINLEAVLLDTGLPETFRIQDTYNTAAESSSTLGDVQDTYNTESESTSTDHDVQDVM